jgi:cell division septum initiation protein DivIVA
MKLGEAKMTERRKALEDEYLDLRKKDFLAGLNLAGTLQNQVRKLQARINEDDCEKKSLQSQLAEARAEVSQRKKVEASRQLAFATFAKSMSVSASAPTPLPAFVLYKSN